MKNKEESFPFEMKVFGVLLIDSFIADGLDIWAYQQFMRSHGIGFFEAPGWKLTFEYFQTFPGNVLALIGLSPWITAIVYLFWKTHFDTHAVDESDGL